MFHHGGGSWTQEAKLGAGDAAPGDALGVSVAVDDRTAVVGAIGDDDGGEDSGSVYAFTRTAGVWTEASKSVADDAAPGDELGIAVAIGGGTTVVGSYKDDDQGLDSGSAYVFVP